MALIHFFSRACELELLDSRTGYTPAILTRVPLGPAQSLRWVVREALTLRTL